MLPFDFHPTAEAMWVFSQYLITSSAIYVTQTVSARAPKSMLGGTRRPASLTLPPILVLEVDGGEEGGVRHHYRYVYFLAPNALFFRRRSGLRHFLQRVALIGFLLPHLRQILK